jgi:hypothetical protein
MMPMIFFFDVLIPMGLYVILCYVISYFVNEKNCYIDNICDWLEPAKPTSESPSDAPVIDSGFNCECGYVFDKESLRTAYNGFGVNSIVCPKCSRECKLFSDIS